MNIQPGDKVQVKSVEELEAFSYLGHLIVLSDTHRRQAGEAVNVVLVDSSDDTFKDDNGYWWMCNMVEEVNNNRTLQIKINEPYQIKMVQRKAFYEGYSWPEEGKEFIDDSSIEINYLYLNPTDDHITWSSRYLKECRDVDVSEYLTDITPEYALMETQRVWKEIADKGGESKLLSKGVDEYQANCPCCQITPDDVPISQESDTCLQYCPMVDVWPDGCEERDTIYQAWLLHKTAENAMAISIAAGEQLKKLRAAKPHTKKEEPIDLTGCHPTIAENIRRGVKTECYVEDGDTPTAESRKRNVIAYGKDWGGWNDVGYFTEETYFAYAIPVDELDAKAKEPKTKTRVKSRDAIVRQLIADGYVLDNSGNWRSPGYESFHKSMWELCGRTPQGSWNWLPQWLEEVEVKK